jgi:hypothetical protein
MSIRRIISALLLSVAASLAHAAPIELAEQAPDRYIVVPGDTLWGIAGKFLKDPWRWPELWRLNKDELRRPQKLSPGDIIVLSRKSEDGEPQLKLAKPVKLSPQQYSEPMRKEIPTIPANIIEPFLSQPLVVDAAGLEQTARIVGTQEGRVFLARGDHAFVSGATADAEVWQVYRAGKALLDPEAESKEPLGYEAFYLGTARRLQPGETALFEMVDVKQEVGRGDRLLPAVRPALLNYVPHKPAGTIAAKVISVYGGVNEAGRHSIIALNRGTDDGVEIGHVLALFRSARNVRTRNERNEKEMVVLPEERSGLAFVFRTFERISYALVMETNLPVTVLDSARNP